MHKLLYLSTLRTKLNTLVGAMAFLGLATAQAQTIKVTALGDILMHEALQIEAQSQPEGFYSLFGSIRPLLQGSDIVYGNLEGPIAPGVLANGKETLDPGFVYDGQVYSGTNFRFNYHPRLLQDLEKLGVHIVSMANNHTLDRGSLGINKSIDQLQNSKLAFSGIRKAGDRFDWTETAVNGLKIGWLSCTEHTNGLVDRFHQVLMCFENENLILKMIAESSSRFDVMILTPHWGEEYHTQPEPSQRRWAQKMVEAGVKVIFGNHPHVIQPWEVLKGRNGEQGLVVYSLGNFIAWQAGDIKKTSGVFTVNIEKSEAVVRITQFSWVPIYRGGKWVAPYRRDMGPEPARIIEGIWGKENPVVLH